MDSDPVVELPTAPAEVSVVVDRRRPGRIEHKNAALIAILRRPPPGSAEALSSTLDDESLETTTDDLISARGIVIGLLLSAPLWGVMGLAIWLLVGR
jgi:hypothetical protein